jgi:transposase
MPGRASRGRTRRARYPSDLTDQQWELVEPLLPAPKTGSRPEKHPRRTIHGSRGAVDKVMRGTRMHPRPEGRRSRGRDRLHEQLRVGGCAGATGAVHRNEERRGVTRGIDPQPTHRRRLADRLVEVRRPPAARRRAGGGGRSRGLLALAGGGGDRPQPNGLVRGSFQSFWPGRLPL